MEKELRNLLQIMTRRFGLLNENCCSVGDLDISLVQSQIIYEIDRQKQASMQEIASSLGLELSRFSHQIQTLIKRDLVEKTASAADKRVFVLSLTTLGKFVATAIEQRIQEQLKQITSNMTETEKETVIAGLRLLNKNMESIPACCS